MRNRGFQRRSLFAQPRPSQVKRRKSSWLARIAGFLFRSFKRVCMLIGAMMLVSILAGMIMVSRIGGEVKEQSLPGKMVLYLTMEESYPDYQTASSYDFSSKPNFRHLIDAIDRAQVDARVKGLVMAPYNGSMTMAQMQEFRAAIKRFRSTGKPTWFYKESMDGGMGGYYIAAAFDQIWIQPVGSLNIPGLRAEMPYARTLLDKIGVEPQMFARKEYKDVFGNFTNKEMTKETRESISSLLGDVSSQMVADLADDRKLSPERINALVDMGVLTDQEALQEKLIDRIDYFDVLKKEIRLKAVGTEDAKAMKFVGMNRYIADIQKRYIDPPATSGKPQIVLVYAVGTIMPDDGKTSSVAANASLYGGDIASAEDLAKVIETSAREDDVKAIVLRIDSPGGSPTASETIRRALVYAKEKGKKVVVSMGGTAASGGYWIATPADHIFAMPATITGSIGVAGGKFVLSDLWDKLGVNWDEVEWGKNAGLSSPNQKYSDAGRERMNKIMDMIYDGFIERVAEGRGMTKEQADKVARGRVWSGQSAMAAGLVDEMGGLNQALDHAAVLAGMKSRRDATVIELPQPKTPMELLIELLETQSTVRESLSLQAGLLEMFKPLAAQYRDVGMTAREEIIIK